MEQPLAPLRRDLDFFPSPDRNRPGLVIQDRTGFSKVQIIVPPGLVEPLNLFDGSHTTLDLRAELTRLTGELDTRELSEYLIANLSKAGFLRDDVFERLRDETLAAWRAGKTIVASHCGPMSYAEDPAALRRQLGGWLQPSPGSNGAIRAIASPHASPAATHRSYTAAYGALAESIPREEAADKTFVILGTSHYGEIDRLGTTRKDFVTPLGRARVDLPLLDELHAAGGKGIEDEDYYFSIEHSVEFQVVFLQYLYGEDVRILPLLCGSYARSLLHGGLPEKNDEVRQYLDALRGLHEKHGRRLVWVLGVDMAHMGIRYSDEGVMRANEGAMIDVEQRDRSRIHSLNAGDAEGFWTQVSERRDDLKWCGSAPFYTFLRAMPEARGELLSYEQWQIDGESVVTLGGLRFQ